MNKVVTEISSKKQQYGDLIVTVHDRNGNLLSKVEQPIDSFNRQMWRLLFANLIGKTPSNAGYEITDLSNASFNSTYYSLFALKADGGIDSYTGIVLGSGNTATTYDTVTMQSIIDNGKTEDTLIYLENLTEYDQDQRNATITRTFLNYPVNINTVAVNEIGIALSAGGNSNASKTEHFLTVRDLLDSEVEIPSGYILTVTYKVRIDNGNRNYSNILMRGYGTTRGDTNTVLTNTNSGATVIQWSDGATNVLSSNYTTSVGLVFGTSNTAFNVSQVDLVSRINNGTGTNQLVYYQTINSAFVENSITNSMEFSFSRIVENDGAINVSIYEIGLFTNASGTESYMLDRRVLEPPVTVVAGSNANITWEFKYEL
jgi:hypothetical protein